MPKAKKEEKKVTKPTKKAKESKVKVNVDENNLSDTFENLKFQIRDIVNDGGSITKEELLKEIECYDYTDEDFEKLLAFLEENKITVIDENEDDMLEDLDEEAFSEDALEMDDEEDVDDINEDEFEDAESIRANIDYIASSEVNSSDSVKVYLHQAGKYRLLKPEEERRRSKKHFNLF